MRSAEISEKGISTPGRFLYLNTYAFLLLLIGGGIFSISLFHVSIPALVAQAIVALVCFKGAFSIFNSWDDKKRKYDVLIQRNKDEFRSDTFKEFMTAPCGRLLVRLVLKDLGIPHRYKELAIYRPSIIEEIKQCNKPRQTKVVIHRFPAEKSE